MQRTTLLLKIAQVQLHLCDNVIILIKNSITGGSTKFIWLLYGVVVSHTNYAFTPKPVIVTHKH